MQDSKPLPVNTDRLAAKLICAYQQLPEAQKKIIHDPIVECWKALEKKAEEERYVLATASISDLFEEIARRGQGTILATTQGAHALLLFNGPMHACLGISTMMHQRLMTQVQVFPYDGPQK